MFNAVREVDNIITFIRDYFNSNKLSGVVIGISGGKDSAVSAALFCKAIGSENVIGVAMPCHSSADDLIDAKLVADTFDFKLISVDLNSTYNSFIEEVSCLDDYVKSDDSNINIKPRLRMSTLYYIAQMYSKKYSNTYIVAGNSNKSEEYVGYFTKGGDSVCDIKVLSDFFCDEVIELGKVLGVPSEILDKKPSDGLSGLSDEDKLGFSYLDVKKVVLGEEVDSNIKDMIINKHKANSHKFNIPSYKR